MATKLLMKAGPQSRRPQPPRKSRVTRFTLPDGDGLIARVARGLARWREQHNLTVPAASKQFQVDQTAWYRIERGTHPATTAVHIDVICEALGVDIIDLIQLGT